MLPILPSLLSLGRASEGFRPKAYRCPAGKWTVGYGHTDGVSENDTRTLDQAERDLIMDMEKAQARMKSFVKKPLSWEQANALTDFVFNCGAGNFANSTLLRLVNDGQFDLVPDEIRKWHHVDGKDLEGLVVRRNAEANMWEGLSGESAARKLIEGVSLATVHVLNAEMVDYDRESSGKVSKATAVFAKNTAVTRVLCAVAPHLDDSRMEALEYLRPLAESMIEQAVDRLKLPEAVLEMFPAERTER